LKEENFIVAGIMPILTTMLIDVLVVLVPIVIVIVVVALAVIGAVVTDRSN
jgi:hypothetical protein